MKKILRSLLTVLFLAASLILPGKAQAKVDSDGLQNASKPFVLQHAKEIFNKAGQKMQLAWHSSHYSHASHASHESHYSHYSSRY